LTKGQIIFFITFIKYFTKWIEFEPQATIINLIGMQILEKSIIYHISLLIHLSLIMVDKRFD